MNTELNPADMASRGLQPADELGLHKWIRGPDFLWKSKDNWPELPTHLPLFPDDDPEMKRDVVVNYTKCEPEEVKPLDKLINHYSSWYKLQKAVAWMIRFKRHLKKEKVVTGELRVNEIQYATDEIISYVQCQTFPEFEVFNKGHQLTCHSRENPSIRTTYIESTLEGADRT